MVRTRLYRNGTLISENFPVQDVSEYLRDPASVIWLDLYEPEHDEFAVIGEECGLHELAVEHALHQGQRPKIDHYRTHIYLNAYATSVGEDGDALSVSEIAAFVTNQALITVRKSPGIDIDEVMARWDGSPELASEGVGFLLHGLLDLLVDGHFRAVQALDDSIEKLEDLVFAEGREQVLAVQRQVLVLRRSLVDLRRTVLPMREVVNTLMRPGLRLVTVPLAPYYQEVYDHVLRATEWTESLRDLMNSVVETNLAVQANRVNTIMKKVTSWAAIIAVPTAVTGFYGQNVPYPGFAHEWGFAVSSGVIVLLALALYLVFSRKDWI
ncbi:magnesium transporter CorA family protein [Streptomyces sp. NBC_01497]|uniref:magnesium transporter CorA family protein n=1 Tax=Streptomyces sp. NBC_01497 TaxID=2903885 RepID=UPI002E308953|nr:magnesium transporter CorA family protein [Streptomyces sp. NBC_01497]